MSDDKGITSGTDTGYASHNEKETGAKIFEPESPGRRQSVALNLVENPLKVSHSPRFALPHSH